MQRTSEQTGGTPFPLRYFDGTGSQPCNFGMSNEGRNFGLGLYNTCGQSGGATPMPAAWFNPNAGPGMSGSQSGCDLDGNPKDFINMFYRSERAVQTALQCADSVTPSNPAGEITPTSGSQRGNRCMHQTTQFGGASGAPFFIPNYGRNPNQTSGQMDAESQMTTGFSYRFETPPSCTPFCSQWGNNSPSFNPV